MSYSSDSDSESFIDDSIHDSDDESIQPIETEDNDELQLDSDIMIENPNIEEEEQSFQKIHPLQKQNFLDTFHPEENSLSTEEITALSTVIRNEYGDIIDPLHKTSMFMTKYEYTHILGLRTKQLNEGSKPFVEVDSSIIDGYLIAQLEMQQKKIPFLICRPLPGGAREIWKVKDLEILCY